MAGCVLFAINGTVCTLLWLMALRVFFLVNATVCTLFVVNGTVCVLFG
jgi:hypothetical protein